MSHSDDGVLKVKAPGAVIHVSDAYLAPVIGARTTDLFESALAPGAYSVAAEIGRSRVTQLVLVRPGARTSIELAVPFEASGPVDISTTLNETHAELSQRLTGDGAAREGYGRFIIVLRTLRDHIAAPLTQVPVIHDAGDILVDVPAAEEASGNPGSAYGWKIELPSGAYRVCWGEPDADRAGAEHSVWVAAGYQTVVFVPQGPTGPDSAAMSMHMIPDAQTFLDPESGSEEVERLLNLLGAGRALDEHELSRHLTEDAPVMAQLVAAAYALRRLECSGEIKQRLSGTATNLRKILGPMPDVLALHDALHSADIEPVAFPPVLSDALDILLRVDREDESVIPAGSLCEEICSERYGGRPWLLWRPLHREAPEISAQIAGEQVYSLLGAQKLADWGNHGALMIQYPGLEGDDHRVRFRQIGGDLQRRDGAEVGRQLHAASEPLTGMIDTPSKSALDRVQAVVVPIARRWDIPQLEAAIKLGHIAVAQRAGIPGSLAQRCIDLLYTESEHGLSADNWWQVTTDSDTKSN